MGVQCNIYANQADELIDIVKYNGGNSGTYSTDKDIIPIFDRIINKNNKLLVVIHSKGSHVRYSARYPKEFEVFKPAMSDKIDFSFVSMEKRSEICQ